MEPKQETMGDVFKYLPSNTLHTKEEKKGCEKGWCIDHVSSKITLGISHFTDNKFGISCFKTFLYDKFFSLRLRTTAKELPRLMASPFSRFLFLVL